jgi:hypothetical protein
MAAFAGPSFHEGSGSSAVAMEQNVNVPTSALTRIFLVVMAVIGPGG